MKKMRNMWILLCLFYRLCFISKFEHRSRHDTRVCVCVEYVDILEKVRISLRHEICLVCFFFYVFLWLNFSSSVFRTNESSSDLLVYNRFLLNFTAEPYKNRLYFIMHTEWIKNSFEHIFWMSESSVGKQSCWIHTHTHAQRRPNNVFVN